MNSKEAIIRALKSCACRKCSECPYRGKGISCKYRLMEDAANMLESSGSHPGQKSV